jgi:hypothetical protein
LVGLFLPAHYFVAEKLRVHDYILALGIEQYSKLARYASLAAFSNAKKRANSFSSKISSTAAFSRR